MSEFFPLTVTDIRKETRQAVVVTLEPREKDKARFDFIPGQYLTFRREFEGVELRRCYSICTSRNEGKLKVGIKRVEGGCFSNWANEDLRPGEVLDALPPNGNFHAKNGSAKSYLFFAGGSGITPVLSLISSKIASEPEADFSLVYANRAASSIMFLEELEDLKSANLNRFSLIHVLESETDAELFSGRLDKAKCDQLFGHWIDVESADWAFICGPEPMMLAVSQALETHGMPRKRIKLERFLPNQPGRVKRRRHPRTAGESGTLSLSVRLNGETHQLNPERGDQSLLEAALEAGLAAPFSCQAGVCATCRARLVDGKVEMDNNYALDDYELGQGYILTCQSHPQSENIVIDYDQ